ncbi:MAG: glycine hydroxymethyltransferase [Candidatus Tokpelaia sp. JSC188]|nr:MAG: glycine hydroxymethyltransferase [Candidatus Tokpelaia sp. JSC188]
MAQGSTVFIENFFNNSLGSVDPDVFNVIRGEFDRQYHEIELIASENIVSRAVMEAQGSLLTNKYAEGYPGKRYYGGCQFVDIVEELAIERATRLFDCAFANVQPNSGSQMNQAVFLALLTPGDTFMGLSLNSGGHLSHGSLVNMSGRWFNVVPYSVRSEDQLLDMDEVASIAYRHRPKLILAGGTAYSRIWDWKRFREIADEVDAYLMVDMAHIAGLVAAGVHPSPLPFAHVVTTTTHKSLRGPRGGMVLTNDEGIARKVDSAVFPGLQGGPLMHVIAAKAVAFGEALQPEFKIYAAKVVSNARTLANSLRKSGFDIVSGGTDNHLMLVDLRSKNVTGNRAENALGRSGIICNKNSIPFDSEKPFMPSGIRLGTPAGTTRGFGELEFKEIALLISEVLNGLKTANSDESNATIEQDVRRRVTALTNKFPLYPCLR